MSTMTPVKGCDYSTGKPRISALEPAGIKFAVRYLSPGANPKNLTKPELTALLAAGEEVAVVFESTAGRILAGHDAGVTDATTADAELKALGLAGLPAYFACDVDPRSFTANQWTLAMAYLDGVASEISLARTGGYGGYAFIKHAFDAKKITYGWQTYAWSLATDPLPPHAVKVKVPGDDRWFMFDTRAQLRQVRNGVPLAGGTVDLDEAHAADYGQWPRPPAPGPYRHVVPAGNTLTLSALAKSRNTTAGHIADVTHKNADTLHVAVFDAYIALGNTLHVITAPEPVMPEGLVYFTSNK